MKSVCVSDRDSRSAGKQRGGSAAQLSHLTLTMSLLSLIISISTELTQPSTYCRSKFSSHPTDYHRVDLQFAHYLVKLLNL